MRAPKVAVQERWMHSGIPCEETATSASLQENSKSAPATSKSTVQDKLLPEDQWLPIYNSLRPFLRPCGDVGSEGHLDFFHRSVSKSVRLRYLSEMSEPTAAEIREYHYKIFANFLQGRDATKLDLQEVIPIGMELATFNADLVEHCRRVYDGEAAL